MAAKKRLQVFISSTFTDLKLERQAAVEAILSAGHIPAGMELFTAGDQSQWEVIKRWIDESDAYLLILGGRYGSIDKSSGKSYTHLEYEYAVDRGKPLFAVVITPEHLEHKVKSDGLAAIEQDNTALLKGFRDLVMTKMIRPWNDPRDIKLAIHETLNEFARRDDLVGCVRSDQARTTEELKNLVDTQSALLSANAEIRSLRDALAKFESQRSEPELHVEVVNYATRKPFVQDGEKIAISLLLLEDPEIPDYHPSGAILYSWAGKTNRDYYREAIEFLDFRLRHRPIALKVWNSGSTAAINTRVVINFAKSAPMSCVLERDAPERPEAEKNQWYSNIRPVKAYKQRLDTLGDTFDLIEELGTVQPQGTTYSEAEIFIAPSRSHADEAIYTLHIQIFADNLSQPVSTTVDLPFEITRRKFDNFASALRESLAGPAFVK
jgi:hypothetical protein